MDGEGDPARVTCASSLRQIAEVHAHKPVSKGVDARSGHNDRCVVLERPQNSLHCLRAGA